MENIPPQITQYTDQSLSAIHHALRASRRRLVIGLVAYRTLSSSHNYQHNTITSEKSTNRVVVVEASQLAREIVSIEDNISVDHATGERYHNVYTSLIQTHLPELDSLGAVEYDGDRKEVRPDRNLVALAMVAAITSPVAKMLFHSAISKHDLGGPKSAGSSIGD